jgi:hypothetical protein
MKVLGILLVLIVLIGGAGIAWFTNALIQQNTELAGRRMYECFDNKTHVYSVHYGRPCDGN